tara:strand:+ start:107 stop:313 length:207 start_codon:yes stop_codon:yes gene_type:complete
MEEDKLIEVKRLWAVLGNIPVNEDDEIEEAFVTDDGYIFDVGTEKFDIWHWFEDRFDISVAYDLMYVN